MAVGGIEVLACEIVPRLRWGAIRDLVLDTGIIRLIYGEDGEDRDSEDGEE